MDGHPYRSHPRPVMHPSSHLLPSPAPHCRAPVTPPCQRPVGAPTCPRRPPEPAGRARCSCLFINMILKTFLINSSRKICLDALRLLYRLSPGQRRDCVEDSRGSVPGTSVPAWALPATPAGPQDCCSWDAHRPAAVGHQSPHTGSAAQAFITAMKEACRRRGEGWEALSGWQVKTTLLACPGAVSTPRSSAWVCGVAAGKGWEAAKTPGHWGGPSPVGPTRTSWSGCPSISWL